MHAEATQWSSCSVRASGCKKGKLHSCHRSISLGCCRGVRRLGRGVLAKTNVRKDRETPDHSLEGFSVMGCACDMVQEPMANAKRRADSRVRIRNAIIKHTRRIRPAVLGGRISIETVTTVMGTTGPATHCVPLSSLSSVRPGLHCSEANLGTSRDGRVRYKNTWCDVKGA